MNTKHTSAFTLIELLIVVAIIAILAAIAVPNFLEAQTRSKVSRVKADQRTVVTALESYYVDLNKYPPEDNPFTPSDSDTAFSYYSLIRLTTPVAYLTEVHSLLRDPFLGTRENTQSGLRIPGAWAYDYANYSDWADLHVYSSRGSAPNTLKFNACGLMSCGPDGQHQGGLWGPYLLYLDKTKIVDCTNNIYDPTNGTVSVGEIIRLTGEYPSAYGNLSK